MGNQGTLGLAKETFQLDQGLVRIVFEQGQGIFGTEQGHARHVDFSAHHLEITQVDTVVAIIVAQCHGVRVESVPGIRCGIHGELDGLAFGRHHQHVSRGICAKARHLEIILVAVALENGIRSKDFGSVAVVGTGTHIVVVSAQHHVSKDSPALLRRISGGFRFKYHAGFVGRIQVLPVHTGNFRFGGKHCYGFRSLVAEIGLVVLGGLHEFGSKNFRRGNTHRILLNSGIVQFNKGVSHIYNGGSVVLEFRRRDYAHRNFGIQ